MSIELAQIGSHLGTRFAAVAIREKIISSLTNNEQVIIDFGGVETVSDSFADECFAKLIFDFEFDNIKNKVTFKNASPFIKAIIANAYKERISHREMA